jgi:hypothetical protein
VLFSCQQMRRLLAQAQAPHLLLLFLCRSSKPLQAYNLRSGYCSFDMTDLQHVSQQALKMYVFTHNMVSSRHTSFCVFYT